MNSLNAYISDLLYDYECVVLPDLGGLVANPVPSEYSNLQHEFKPPKKQLSFNVSLTNNDGLLVSKVAEGEHISFDQAQEKVQAFISSIKRELREFGFYDFTDIGVLETRAHEKLIFHPNEHANYLRSSFGLKSVRMQPMARPIEKTRDFTHENRARKSGGSQVKREQIRARFLAFYLPLVFSAIPILAYLFWIPLNTNMFSDGQFSFSDLNPFTEKKCAQYVPRSFKEVFAFTEFEEETGDKSVFNPTFDKQTTTRFYLFERNELFYDKSKSITVRLLQDAVSKVDSTRVASIQQPAASKGFQYHIIAGCFSELNNATALVDKLKLRGFDAEILDKKGGLYRVSIGGFSSKRQAIDTLPELRNQVNSGAWVAKK